MNMRLFYAQDIDDQMVLDANESGHAIRTLRMLEGDELHLINGKGSKYKAVIQDAHPKACRIAQVELLEQIPPPTQKVHLAFAPPKSSDRLEWLIEKGVEIGVSAFTPLLCRRSERKKINESRLVKIMVSALKQSGGLWLPALHPMQTFSSIEHIHASQKLIAHCLSDTKKELSEQPFADHTILLIGPEGDFSPEEIAFANDKGFESVSLGTSTLRTETACIVGATILLHS